MRSCSASNASISARVMARPPPYACAVAAVGVVAVGVAVEEAVEEAV
jgi:hypothetical protein